MQGLKNKIIMISYKKISKTVVDLLYLHKTKKTVIREGLKNHMHCTRLKKTGFCVMVSMMTLIQPCYVLQASVFGGSSQCADQSENPDHHAEAAPESIEKEKGEGTLSPPSESSEGSIFGQAQVTDAVDDEELSGLLSNLAFPVDNGNWSAYVCNLEANTEGSINEHQMQAASLIKLYIMGAVYENYESIIEVYDRNSVENNLHAMITVSDNDAANTLTGYLGEGDAEEGMRVVNDYCNRNGYINTHMGRLLLQSNEFDDNYTSAADCGHFLKNIYDGWKEGDSRKVAMFEHLAAQERRNKIPAQMPTDVSIANKTGELADVENDAGIIYDTDNDFVIVFMSENLSETGSAQNTIAALSRQIYDYYQQ